MRMGGRQSNASVMPAPQCSAIAKYMPVCVGSALEVPPRPSSAQLALSQQPTTCPLLWAATLARLDLHARVAPPCLSHALPDGSAPHPAKRTGASARARASRATSALGEAPATHRASAVSAAFCAPPHICARRARTHKEASFSLVYFWPPVPVKPRRKGIEHHRRLPCRSCGKIQPREGGHQPSCVPYQPQRNIYAIAGVDRSNRLQPR